MSRPMLGAKCLGVKKIATRQRLKPRTSGYLVQFSSDRANHLNQATKQPLP
ncbi:hypothetical protein DPMN_027437 [Dreissena polymorpha]|uniref:Uncharacterized protein n=1 Tax=Dreissena polymorpha TaxID=45954 RepID=A0A9D4RDM3_DREPO|nr:hypothetical protein DPMN_027437 [Dreissena polymorpha]